MVPDDLTNLIKQAEKMQESMQRIQQKLEQIVVKGQAGAGLVTIEMTCKYEVQKVKLDPSLFKEEKDMLPDLIAAAFNDAVRKIEGIVQKEVGGIAKLAEMPSGSSNPSMPSNFNLPS